MTERNLLDAEATAPKLGMGCWQIGGPMYFGDTFVGYSGTDDASSRETIKAALDAGISLFDTAVAYGAGHSERLLGEVIGNRDDVLISTKVGLAVDEDRRQIIGPETDPDDIARSVEASLTRLQRERIDVLFLHLNQLEHPAAEAIFGRMEDLVADGKVGSFGWSTDFPDNAKLLAEFSNATAVQHAMNLFFDAPSMQSTASELGLQTFNRSPLAMGVLGGRFDDTTELPAQDIRAGNQDWLDYFKDGKITKSHLDRLNKLRELLTVDGRTLVQGALGWLWAKSPENIPLPGARTAAQITESAQAQALGPLPLPTLQEIEDVLQREPEGTPRER